MSRHRDVRNMDYSDDYHGYDDVYGHSVDDDYYVSPSDAQFIYNRENSREQNHFMHIENDIKEDDDGELEQAINELSPENNAKLKTSVSKITEILGSTNISEKDIVKALMQFDFNIERSVNMLLERTEAKDRLERKEKDLGDIHRVQVEIRMLKLHNGIPNHTSENGTKTFIVPKLKIKGQSKSNKFSVPKLDGSTQNSENKSFVVPQLNFAMKYSDKSPMKNGLFSIPKLNFDKSNLNSDKVVNGEMCNDSCNKNLLSDLPTQQDYTSLSELVENHLNLTSSDFETIKNSTKQFPVVNGVSKNGIKQNGFFKPRVLLQRKLQPVNGMCILQGLRQSSSMSALPDHVRKKPGDDSGQEGNGERILDSSDNVLDGSQTHTTWNIDLSPALKNVHSSPSLPKRNLEEQFDIPFTDCDPELQGNNRNMLPCTLDASGILQMKLRYLKEPSSFGKVLSRRYKKTLKRIGQSSRAVPTEIRRFSFSTLSPDEEISKHLKR